MLTKEQEKYAKNLHEGLRIALVNLNQEIMALQEQKRKLGAQLDIIFDILKTGNGFEKLFPEEGGKENGLD